MSNILNQIIIKDFLCRAFVGCHEAERELGQTLKLTLTITTDFSKGIKTDNLDDVLCYCDITDSIKNIAFNKKYNLIETFADEVLDKLFDEYQNIQSIDLLLSKPYLPVELQNFNVDIRIIRNR